MAKKWWKFTTPIPKGNGDAGAFSVYTHAVITAIKEENSRAASGVNGYVDIFLVYASVITPPPTPAVQEAPAHAMEWFRWTGAYYDAWTAQRQGGAALSDEWILTNLGALGAIAPGTLEDYPTTT